jgi:hypothetical protein
MVFFEGTPTEGEKSFLKNLKKVVDNSFLM